VRTIFLDFEDPDWEEELEAFYHTDVELPATLRVDGRMFANVGVQFRGNSSYFTVPRGRKRSLSVNLNHANASQQLEGYRALTLLNAHSDPTFLRSVLYLDLARQSIPALGANYVRVAINGELWGVYVNQQRFNRDFLRDAFKTTDGVRFKSSNRSRLGSLSYLGDDPAIYRQWYEIEGQDRDELWKPLINVTKVLAQTPTPQLKAAIEPILNVDGALRYLALDMVAMSGDGYWLFGSDFNLYVDPKGVLHVLHHDTNEAFTAYTSGGRGSARDAAADPLAFRDDPNRALRHKLLEVPEYRERYLRYIRDIARDGLDWSKLEPKINAWRSLIRADVEADTRKLYSTDEFTAAAFGTGDPVPPPTTLKGFIMARRQYLLSHPAIASLR
jgi:spore coat protein CotH